MKSLVSERVELENNLIKWFTIADSIRINCQFGISFC